MTKVVVTGMGVVSAIGNNVEENLASLRAGKTGIGKAQFLDSKYAETHLFGEVSLNNRDLFSELEISEKIGFTRTELLATKAFREAVAQSGLSQEELSSFDTAFLSATTVGGMAETKAIYEDANSNTQPSQFVSSYRTGAHTMRIAALHKLKGYTDTMNTACSSSANAIMLGARLIKSGRAKRAIVGGVDSLAKYTVNGFNALQIFSDEHTRPFDANRKGLNLGEAAAYLVLEAEDESAGKEILGVVSGYGNSNDAHHPSAMSPDAVGVRGAITGALETSGLKPADIDHINAHGTGTGNNDYTELHGMTLIFGDVPPFVSTKGYTGHTLAAAGSVEAVFSLLSLQNDEIYPSLHHQEKMPEFESLPQTEFLADTSVHHILSNSFGFGGNCSSLIFSKT